MVWQWISICESTSTDVNACSQSSDLHRSGINCQSRLTVTSVVSDFSQDALQRRFRSAFSRSEHSGSTSKGRAAARICQLWSDLAIHSSRSADVHVTVHGAQSIGHGLEHQASPSSCTCATILQWSKSSTRQPDQLRSPWRQGI